MPEISSPDLICRETISGAGHDKALRLSEAVRPQHFSADQLKFTNIRARMASETVRLLAHFFMQSNPCRSLFDPDLGVIWIWSCSVECQSSFLSISAFVRLPKYGHHGIYMSISDDCGTLEWINLVRSSVVLFIVSLRRHS